MADIWDNLNATKIGDDPGQAIDTQTRNIHLERANKELLSDVNLINQATFRSDGGYIPGTGSIKSVTVTDDTRTVFFQPGRGEVWQIFSGYASLTGVGSTVNHNLYFKDLTNDNLILWFYYGSSSSSLTFGSDSDWKPSYFMDENLSLEYVASGTFTDSTLYLSMMRVR